MNISPNTVMPEIMDTAPELSRRLKRQAEGSAALNDKERQKLKKISQDFEGLFVGMMMKSMRETVAQKDTLTGGGHGEDVYRSMLDQEYAAAAVKRGGFGLAVQIEKELVRQEARRIPRVLDTKE